MGGKFNIILAIELLRLKPFNSSVGLFYSIYYVYTSAPELVREQNCKTVTNFDELNDIVDVNNIKCLVLEYLPSIVVTVANSVGPFLIFTLIGYEKYKANTTLLLSLAWCIFLR